MVMVVTADVAIEHGSFTCICQLVPVCTSLFLGSMQVKPPNSISTGSAIFAGLTVPTNTHRQTDHNTCNIYSSNPHLALVLVDAG